MTVQQLKYFIAVAQTLHFGEAARACFVSQPSLSHSISELETELGLRLLYRDNRSVSLSPAGRVFYDDAVEIVRRLDDAVIKARRADAGYSGRLRIGTLGGLAAEKFPSSIASFKEKYPDIDVDLVQTNMKKMNTDIMRGELDIMLTRREDVIFRSNELDWHKLYSDRFCYVVRRDSALTGRAALEKSDIEKLPFIFLDPTITPNIYNHTLCLCTSRGFVPDIKRLAPSLEIACTLVKSGLGIAILPGCAEAYSSGSLKLIPLEGDDALSDVVLAWRRRNLSPIVPVFLEEFGIDSVG